MEEIIHVVLSRERGLIDAFKKLEKAEICVKDQTLSEEMAGSRPSVWIKSITLK